MSNDQPYVIESTPDYWKVIIHGQVKPGELPALAHDIARTCTDGPRVVLVDITDVDHKSITLRIQGEGIGAIWMNKDLFRKTAFLLATQEMHNLLVKSLAEGRFGDNHRPFWDEKEAVEWLKENS